MAIAERLRGKNHLIMQETSLFSIPERLAEYDPDFFVVFNRRKGKYEVHSLANRGDTHCMDVLFDGLDARILRQIARTDQRRHSFKELVRQVDNHNERLEAQNERHRRSELNAFARESRSAFQKIAWS